MQPSPDQPFMNACLVIRPGLRFDHRLTGQDSVVVIEDPIRGKFFQVGLAEYSWISSFDGKRTLQQSIDGRTPGDVTAAPLAVQTARWLLQNNLAYLANADQSKILEEQARQVRIAKLVSILNPVSFKIPLFNPNRVLARLQPLARILFSWWFLVAWLAAAIYAVSILASEWNRLGEETVQIFSGYRWMTLLIVWVLLKLIHETAHGLACRKFGGEVPEAGVLFILFTPMAYVNVTSMWRFANRWQRMLVSIAGIYIELFLAFIALGIWQRYPGATGDIAFNVFLTASVSTLLFNANPLMRFDGYFIFSDLLNIQNLYSKGVRWLDDRFKAIFFGSERKVYFARPFERRVVKTYGLLAWVWKILIGISLTIAASVLFQGAGLALAGFCVLMWYALPAYKTFRWFQKARANGEAHLSRVGLSGAVAAAMVLAMFFVFKAPATKSAPAIVQFEGEQIIRARSDGFIQEISVRTGQTVEQGDTVMILDNPRLKLEVFELERLIQESTIQARIKTRQGELALAQAENERLASLNKQWSEKKSQRDELVIKAPAKGVVMRRDLDQQTGRYVKAGDELFSLAPSDSRLIMVSIDQRDWDSLKGNEGRSMQILFAGTKMETTRLRRIYPAASTALQHPSMGSNLGGPLSVKRASSASANHHDEVELLSPRFSVELELDESVGQAFYSGQRGWAFFESNQQSLGGYLYLAITDWVRHKIELAMTSAD